MTLKTNSGRSMLADGAWVRNVAQERSVAEGLAEHIRESLAKPAITVGNVVGGSLDGATMPEGTRDGQQYRWDADRRRWDAV